MYINFTLLTAVAVTTGLLVACDSGEKTDNPSNAASQTSANTGGNSNGSFFNADDGLDFANRLGGSLTKMFEVANDAGGNSIEGYREEPLFSTRAAQHDSIPCDQGSLETVVNTEDGTDLPTSFALTFNNCRNEDSLANGSITLSLSGDEQNLQMSMVFDNFSTTEGSDTSSIDGAINITGSQSDDVSNLSVSGPSITMVSAGDTLQFSDYSLTVSENINSGSGSMGASANISSSTDGNLGLTINPPFVSQGGNGDYPASGRLTMVHSDGSQLEIQADNGSADSFDYVINDNGTVTSGTERWDNTDLAF